MSVVRTNVDAGLPLCASVRPSDPNFDPQVRGLSERIDVIVDGVTLDDCASWDAKAGWVTRQARSARGELILDERGTPTFETLRGAVEIRWIKEPAA